MSKRDDINRLYQPSIILNKVCACLFYLDVIISFIAIYVGDNIVYYLTIVLVIISFFYMVIFLIDDGVLWYKAESARRKNSIQVAFNINMDKYKTEGYYNNKESDPELSYAINQFESSFFTKEICEKMLFAAIAKILIAVTVLIVACRLVSSDSVLLIIAQTIFSAFVIEDAIRILLFYQRISCLFDKAYQEFITVGISKDSQKVWLKYFCVEYESIKAHYRIRLNESLFKKLNPRLTKEWSKLSKQIIIND